MDLLNKFYEDKTREEVLLYTGSELTFDDLVTKEDMLYWEALKEKDFKRLSKTLTQNMGEGHFMDDEEELDSDKDDGPNVPPQPVDDDEEN